MRRPVLLVLAGAVVAGLLFVAAAIGTGRLAPPWGDVSAASPVAAPTATPEPAPSPSPTSLPARTSEPSAAPTPIQTPAATPAPTPAQPTPTPGVPLGIDGEALSARLQAALDAGSLAMAAPGIVASVLLPDGRQWSGSVGVADLATGRALSPATPFAVASISKTFLAAEILALVGEGRLGLDDAVAPLLPETLVGGLPIDGQISVRMLLDHTSGLRDFLVSRELDRAVRDDPGAAWTPEQSLAYAGRPLAPPGKGYHYANTNYVLLGLVAERLAARPLAEEYRARFFEPLGLASASYQGVEPPVAELPTAYRFSSLALDAAPADVTDGSAIRPFTAITTAAGAAGSLAASAPDLARWARALYTGHVVPTRLVREMIDDAARVGALDPPAPYGLGVQVVAFGGLVSYGHSGRLVGARSVVRWFPGEGVAIAIVTNQSRFDPTPLLVDLLAVAAPPAVSDGWRGIEIGAPANRIPVAGTTADLPAVPMGLARRQVRVDAAGIAGGAPWTWSRRSPPEASSAGRSSIRPACAMISRPSSRSISTG